MEQQPEETVTDKSQIVTLLEYAASHNMPVTLNFPNDPQSYFTSVSSRQDEVLGLQEGHYVAINMLGPPQGNEKISQVASVAVRFYTDEYKVTFTVPWVGKADERRHKLAFPTEVVRSSQSRDYPRFKVTKKYTANLSVVLENGQAVPVKLMDISRSGISFYNDDLEQPVKNFSTVQLKSHTPPLPDLSFQVRVIGSKITQKGHHCHRAYFSINSHQERENLNQLVDHLMQHAKTVQEAL
ncbi:MAG: flagellar brake protein [Magnetococcales bacterium]|nr:flagellar brake protein [Magnetococcales bacterium]NGZ25958.1 flagellar brake protein [Magnetococcales bacterium]